MIKKFKKICFLFIGFLLFCITNNFGILKEIKVKANQLLNTYNEVSEIVMEVNTNRVLHKKSCYEKKYMASTTKILTAITIIDNFDITKVVKVPKETVGVEGSSIYLEEGEELSIKDLLYGLMLRSGNDCAETLAVTTCGSIESFAKLMNEKAKSIGAHNSNFVNPHGLHDDNHYTTAYDLALISCYAIKNSTFKEIVSCKSKDIPFTTRNIKRHLINKNKMLNNYDGATGIKTGYTKKAGRCLVTSAFKNGMEIVSVVLNCPNMWEKSKEILDKSFNDFSMKKIVESDNIIDFIDLQNGKKIGVYIKNDVSLPLSENETNKLKTEIVYNDISKGFIKKDTEIGKMNFYLENNLIFQEKIYNIIDM